MPQTVYLNARKSAQVFEASPETRIYDASTYTQYPNPADGTATKVLLKFGTTDTRYRYRPIQPGAKIWATYSRSGSETRPYFWVKLCDDADFKDFDMDEINWNTTPAYRFWSNVGSSVSWGSTSANEMLLTLPGRADYLNAKTAWRLAREPVFLFVIDTTAPNSAYVVLSNPYPGVRMEITVGDEDVNGLVQAVSPTGAVDRSQPQTFKWEFAPEGNAYVLGDWTQTAATFRWRTAGGSWNTIALTDEQQVTIPANTFPAGGIEWQVIATNNEGIESSSAITSIPTSAPLVVAAPSSPTNGYHINETKENLFVWTASGEQTKADLQWSEDASAWTDLASVTGPTLQCAVPANTFPGRKNLYWRIRAYNTENTAGDWSQPAAFSTIDTLPSAIPISPENTIEDGSKEILFSWSVTNASGEPQTSSELQYSDDGVNWNGLATVQGASTHYSLAPGSLTAGEVFWRVKANNRQGEGGPWSEAISFQCIAAPPAPNLSVTPVPFAVINWQSIGQQAYRVRIDGTTYGPFWGEANEFVSPVFLQDGDHTAAVEVQGIYGFWSVPGEISFSVRNVPGDEIELNLTPTIDALLEWSAPAGYDSFTVYRDGKPIAKTSARSFTDRVVLGYHSYFVVYQMQDGNYSKSNTVSEELFAKSTSIAALTGGDWLPLRLSENSVSSQEFSRSRSASLRHVTGAKYPVCEISKFEDLSGSYDVAYKDAADAAPLEALLGKIVIVKSRGGNVVIGPLVSLNKVHYDLYMAYRFTIQQSEWEDFIDDSRAGV